MDHRLQQMIANGLRSPAHAQDALRKIQESMPQFDTSPAALSRGMQHGQTGPRTPPGLEQRNPFGARSAMTPSRAAIVQSFLAPTRLIVVPDLAAAAPAATTTGRVQFQGGAGWLWGWRGSPIAPLAAAGSFQEAQSSLFVEFNINGRTDKVTDGRNVARASFETLFGTINGVPAAPLRIYLNQRDTLNFIIENRHPANTYTPTLTLSFIDDPHMQLADLLFCDGSELNQGAGTTR